MSDINIRITASEEEVTALIAEIEEAVAQRERLLLGARLPGARMAPSPSIGGHGLITLEFRIAQLETRLMDVLNELLQLRDKKVLTAMLDPENIDMNMERWVAQYEAAQARRKVEVEGLVIPPELLVGGADIDLPWAELAAVERGIEQLKVELGDAEIFLLQTYELAKSRTDEVKDDWGYILADAEVHGIKLDIAKMESRIVGAEVENIEAEVMGLQELLEDVNLPSVSRGLRMIFLRLPGLRETLSLMWQIKMIQRELLRPGAIGKVTAAIIAVIYLVKGQEKRQRALEARMDQLEADTDKRNITLEQAVERFGKLPERYRSTVPP